MKKVFKDRSGQVVPTKYVPTIDKKRTALVEKHVKKARALQTQMEKFKAELLADSDALFEEMKSEANVRTGEKGNYTHTTFDGQMKIEVAVQNRVEFDDHIQLAQAKFDEFLKEKTEGNDDHELAILVNGAFRGRKGQLDTKKVFDMFSYSIKHPLWVEGIELLRKSIKSRGSKRYARIFQADAEGEMVAIDLNFSSL